MMNALLEGVSSFDQQLKSKEAARPEISIIIPVYNQQEKVSASLNRIKSVADRISESFEVVLVNDGSIDGTLHVLENESRQDQRVRLVSYAPNVGKGYAVRRGVLESKGRFVVFVDGDLDISPALIGDYISELKSYDMVIASKRHPLSRVKSPSSRRFLSMGFHVLAKVLTGVRVSDTQAGMKAGRGDVLKRIFEIMVVKRYAFDVELLAVAALMNLRIREMPVEITIDRRFKVKEVARMFKDVLAIGYRLRIKGWYRKQLKARND